MDSGPRQRRSTLWAWVYAVFDPADGVDDEHNDERDKDSTETETDSKPSSNNNE